MIKSLKVRNGFYDKASIIIDFTPGLNILSSKNGSGKSHTLECINYALFGTSCLRSSIKDYKEGFHVELIIEIKGEEYRIVRYDGSARISQRDDEDSDWEVKVNGINAVNKHIIELLSYDYKTYSLTNYCAQDSLLTLTSSPPAVLASLIQIISGMDKADVLEDQLRKALTKVRSEKKALLATKKATFEEEPSFVKNPEYDALTRIDRFPSLSAEIKEARENVEIVKIFLKTSKDIFKNYNSSEITMQNLRVYEDLDITVLTESIKSLQEATIKYESYTKQARSIKVKAKTYTEAQLKAQEEQHELYNEYSNYKKIKKQLERHKVTCPSCKHSFYNTDIKLEGSFDKRVKKPTLNLSDILEYRQWNIDKERLKLLNEERAELQSFLENNPSLDDVDKEVSNYNKYIKAKETLMSTKNTLEVFFTELRDSAPYKEFLATPLDSNFQEDFIAYSTKYIEVYEELIRQKEALLHDLTVYLSEKKAYKALMKTLETMDSKLLELDEKLEQLENIYEILITTKKSVLSQSLPVVNKLASDLLHTITSEERSSIQISNSFDILLDNLPINVAEMSAQVISNVALRFSLLNTFYKDSMLLFIGDEIDSSLHEDRFNYLEKCLNNLTDLGYQIILVSHKEFFTGNIIDLQRI